MLDDFLVRAALAGVGVALAAAPLGCFVVWRRLAYFGDATAHSALLGVALGLALGAPILAGTLTVAVVMAFGVALLTDHRRLASDTLLGVSSHAALAFGVVALSQMPGIRVDLIGYLFGDILAVGRAELASIWIGAVVVIGFCAWMWRDLLNATLSESLMIAEGGRPRRARLLLMAALAGAIAIAMQVVGLLLVTAMLILPAGAARPWARTPEGMALVAAAIGVGGALGGVALSLALDAPTGPTIVTVLFAVFCAGLGIDAARAGRGAR